MRLTDICAAIAAEIRAAGLPAAYPAPGAGRLATPLVVIFSGQGTRERAMGEQYFFHTIRGRVLAASTDVPSGLESVDDKLETVADHFDPDVGNDDAFHLRNYQAGKSVDGCELTSWELSNVVSLGGHDYLGGDLFFNVKVRRQRNDP